MTRHQWTRRGFLAGAGLSAALLPFYRFREGGAAHAFDGDGVARRVIFFYFPDGVPGQSADGEPSLWHPTGGETDFALPDMLSALAPYRDDCVFFRGLSMGQTDAGSHPGGAKKLLTAVDGGNGVSIDQHLAQTVGADRPYRHLHLGAMANINGASGDKHISYVGPGQSVAPDDDPVRAFGRLFDGGTTTGGGGGGGGGDARRQSILDASRADLEDLRGRVGGADRARLELHAEALRELEARLGGGNYTPPTCEMPSIDGAGLEGDALYRAEQFPRILRAQLDVTVQAMACELTRVAVIQASHHTSDLAMSRFADTPMYDPGRDMRSHEASHYGPRHDLNSPLVTAFIQQRRWFVDQLVYLLDQLAQRPEGDGTMLDYSIVVLCTEVNDGNTHAHDDMPFVVVGKGGGALRTGRLLDVGYRRHGDLYAAIARAMGDGIERWGQDSQGPVPGLLA